MTVADLASGVQYTVDNDGRLVAVVVTASLWRRLLDDLEDAEDRDLVEQLKAKLSSDPVKAGALPWSSIAHEWQ